MSIGMGVVQVIGWDVIFKVGRVKQSLLPTR